MLLKQHNKTKILFLIVFAFVTIAAIIYLVQSHIHFSSQDVSFPLLNMIISVFGTYYIFLIFVPLISSLKKRFDIISNGYFILIHIAFSVLLTFILVVTASTFNHLFIGNSITLVERIKFGVKSDFILIFIGYFGLLSTAYFIDFYFKFKFKESELLELKVSKSNIQKHLIIKHKGRLFKVMLDEIKYLEAFDNYVKIRSKESVYLVRNTLKNLSEELKEFDFIRIHRSYTINTKYLQSVEKLKNGDATVYLTSGEKLRMSRSYKQILENI